MFIKYYYNNMFIKELKQHVVSQTPVPRARAEVQRLANGVG